MDENFSIFSSRIFPTIVNNYYKRKNVRRINCQQSIRACVSSSWEFDNGIAIPNKCIIPIVHLTVAGVCVKSFWVNNWRNLSSNGLYNGRTKLNILSI